MKTSFFTAIILGVVTMQQAQAVTLEQDNLYFDDYELGQIDGEGEGDSITDADAEKCGCDSGVNLKLSSEPTCCPSKPQIPFDQQMLLALQELGGKSMTLYDALKA